MEGKWYSRLPFISIITVLALLSMIIANLAAPENKYSEYIAIIFSIAFPVSFVLVFILVRRKKSREP
jgi:hypothetical protein